MEGFFRKGICHHEMIRFSSENGRETLSDEIENLKTGHFSTHEFGGKPRGMDVPVFVGEILEKKLVEGGAVGGDESVLRCDRGCPGVLGAVFQSGKRETKGAAEELDEVHSGKNVEALERISVGAAVPLDAGVKSHRNTLCGHQARNILIDLLIEGVEHVNALIEVVLSAFEAGGETSGLAGLFDYGDLGAFSERGQGGVKSADSGPEDGDVLGLRHLCGIAVGRSVVEFDHRGLEQFQVIPCQSLILCERFGSDGLLRFRI